MNDNPTVEILDGEAPPASARILADANRIEYEKDSIGRRIGVKKLTFLDMHELTILLGNDANNAAALQQAMMVGSVVEIDGDPVARPGTVLQLKALMKRLDFPGVVAASTAMGRFAPVVEIEDVAIKN
jgi:hypothetical protein